MIARSYYIFLFIIIAISSILFSLAKGSASSSFYQLLFSDHGQFNDIFLQLRLPRTLSAFACGGLLALAGCLMQLLLQNPLADPYVLGVSSGAALLTLLMMCLGLDGIYLIGGSWGGSIVSILGILLLARKHHWQTHALLLSGIALACGFSAFISFILFITPNANLHSMLFWLSGDLNGAHFPWFALIVLLLGFSFCLALAPGLNILNRGEKEARALGLASAKYRFALFLLSSLFTATAVSVAGCIGFIGLIVPHLSRLLVGVDHRYSLPISLLFGGSLLTISDTFARTLFAPQQLPVGMLMAIIGVPIFIWLLQK